LYPKPHEHLVDFLDAHPAYLDRARYAQSLRHSWFSNFGRDRFHIVTFEAFVADPAGVARGICESFGLSPAALSAPATARNATVPRPFFHLQRAIARYPSVRKTVRQIPMIERLYEGVRRGGAAVERQSDRHLTAPQRDRVAELLRPSVNELAALHVVDTSRWAEFR
jgi:hypothetical protein